MSLGDMITLVKLRKGNYSLVEEKIAHGAPAIGVAIKDLALPERCVIAAIVRKGEVMIPRGVSVIEEDDEIMAVTDMDGAHQLSELFSPPGKPSKGTGNGNWQTE